MNTYVTWEHLKGFELYGASRDERLFTIGMHTGVSGRLPLGTRPGVILHNGIGNDKPILAAACDVSWSSSKI